METTKCLWILTHSTDGGDRLGGFCDAEARPLFVSNQLLCGRVPPDCEEVLTFHPSQFGKGLSARGMCMKTTDPLQRLLAHACHKSAAHGGGHLIWRRLSPLLPGGLCIYQSWDDGRWNAGPHKQDKAARRSPDVDGVLMPENELAHHRYFGPHALELLTDVMAAPLLLSAPWRVEVIVFASMP